MDTPQFHHDEDNIRVSQTPDHSSNPDSHHKKSEPAGKLAATKKWEWPTMSSVVLNPWWQDKKWWSTLLVISRVIGVSFDPLFLYIPFIDNDHKCMDRNKTVQTAALIFRSLTDSIVLLHIMYQIGEAIEFADSKLRRPTKSDQQDPDWEWGSSMTRMEIREFAKAFSRNLSWRSFLTDVFSILPIPQVLMLGLFFKMGNDGDFLKRRKILTACLLVQYLPRIYRIYLSSTMVSGTTTLVKAASYFSLYIVASHVLGAFWYFFSVQRLTSCWYRKCEQAGIKDCTFNCPKEIESSNKIFLDSLNRVCFVKKPWNDTEPPFDFGMFFDALENDITGKIDFPTKLGYCFWWGLRNLSNFGTSLETSTYVLENCFAILISIIGLLLFLYLIGNVQSYMQMAITRAEEIQKKLESTKNDIELWMQNKNLEDEMKDEISKIIKLKLEEDINVDLKKIFCVLPRKIRKSLARFLCSSMIQRVPKLRQMDEQVLDSIYTYMKPVIYAADTFIFHQGDLLDRLIFITNGTVCTFKSAPENSNAGKEEASLDSVSSMDTINLKSGDFYGEELLEFASSSCTKLPPSPENVRCDTDVEAFVLKNSDLASIISSNYYSWTSGVTASGV